MPVLPAEADIRCPAEKIFDVITDFGGQERWLSKSSAFRGTTAISPDPVRLGTTYREPGPFGVRNGTVTEFERPTAITFRQPMTLRLGAGIVDVTLRYTLTPGPAAGTTHVARAVTITVPPPPAAAGRNVAVWVYQSRYWLLCRSKGAGGPMTSGRCQPPGSSRPLRPRTADPPTTQGG